MEPIENQSRSDAVPASAIFDSSPPPAPTPTASVLEQPAIEKPAIEKPAIENAPGANVDSRGVAFDPAIHQRGKEGPRKRADGSWVPKGGRGRKGGVAVKTKPAAAESYLAPPSKTPSGEKQPDAGNTVITAEVEEEDDLPENPLTPAEAEAAAEGITSCTWGLAGATLGESWEPTETERKVWKDYWRRVSERIGLRIPLLLEGVIHAITSCARRLKNPDPTTRWGRIVAWARGQESDG